MSTLPAARFPPHQQESFLAFTNIAGMQTEHGAPKFGARGSGPVTKYGASPPWQPRTLLMGKGGGKGAGGGRGDVVLPSKEGLAGSPAGCGHSSEGVPRLPKGGGHLGCHRSTPELIGGNSVLTQTLQAWNLGTGTGRLKALC